MKEGLREEMTTEPVFIGGLMKSGTSLLRKLLSQHPNLYGGLETHWFTPPLQQDWRDSSSQRQQWLRAFFEIPEEEFERLKAASVSGTDFFERFMQYCTARAGKRRWVEKTPDNILHLDLIQAHWPHAFFLHVIRDYRDIFASWKRNDKGSLADFIAHVKQVMAHIDGWRQTATLRYAEVRYEHLVTDTKTVLQDVLAFIGEPWVEALHAYEGDETDHRKVLAVTGKSGATTQALARPIFTTSVGQWKAALEPHEIAQIEDALGPHMEHWGWC